MSIIFQGRKGIKEKMQMTNITNKLWNIIIYITDI